MICFDISERETFLQVTEWINSINNEAKKAMPKVLVGCKIDLEDKRSVGFEEGC